MKDLMVMGAETAVQEDQVVAEEGVLAEEKVLEEIGEEVLGAEEVLVVEDQTVAEEVSEAEEATLAGETVSIGDLEKCTRQYAQSVKKNAKYHSNQLKEEMFSAKIALLRRDRTLLPKKMYDLLFIPRIFNCISLFFDFHL